MGQFSHQNVFACLGVFSLGKIPRDFRCPYDSAFYIFDRRDGEQNRNQATVLALADGFVMVDALARIRSSHGVILKAQDEPDVAEAIDRLVGSDVPVVTYATDVPTSMRCGYVGIDNHGAGLTAAYLMDQWLGATASDVLITVSRTPAGMLAKRPDCAG